MQKRRVGYRLSESLMVDMKWALNAEGISPRKKSRWVCKAIELLLAKGSERILNEDLAAGDRINPNKIMDVISMENDLCNSIDSMIYDIRRIDPLTEDLQSMLIRAAIRNYVSNIKVVT